MQSCTDGSRLQHEKQCQTLLLSLYLLHRTELHNSIANHNKVAVAANFMELLGYVSIHALRITTFIFTACIMVAIANTCGAVPQTNLQCHKLNNNTTTSSWLLVQIYKNCLLVSSNFEVKLNLPFTLQHFIVKFFRSVPLTLCSGYCTLIFFTYTLVVNGTNMAGTIVSYSNTVYFDFGRSYDIYHA